MGRNSARLCHTEKDWAELREVFVRAFMNYPLYQYIAQNEHTREEFLRRYFNAHYDIHVRNGNSPLIGVYKTMGGSTDGNQSCGDETDENENPKMKIVGGVLFVMPAEDGFGWDYVTDDDYVRSYNQFKLKEVDEEAFERLKRYEKWETEVVSCKLMKLKIPLWNGLFCAVDPAYSGSGCGSMNYADCMRIIQLQSDEYQVLDKSRKGNSTKSDDIISRDSGCAERVAKPCTVHEKPTAKSNNGHSHKPPFDFPMKLLHSMSMMTHHAHSFPRPKNEKTNSNTNKTRNNHEMGSFPIKKSSLPMVVALSHCHRSAHFHQRNGFRCVKEVPFTPFEGGEPPFSTFVLFNDIFGAGKMEEVELKLGESDLSDEIEHAEKLVAHVAS